MILKIINLKKTKIDSPTMQVPKADDFNYASYAQVQRKDKLTFAWKSLKCNDLTMTLGEKRFSILRMLFPPTPTPKMKTNYPSDCMWDAQLKSWYFDQSTFDF